MTLESEVVIMCITNHNVIAAMAGAITTMIGIVTGWFIRKHYDGY